MIEIGFELEMGTDVSYRQLSTCFSAIFPKIKRRASTRKRDKFSVTHDMSVNCNRLYSDIEVVTPVWELHEGIDALKKMFVLMEMMDSETNNTAGLHINIGFADPDDTKKIDIATLVFASNEKKWLGVFGRTRNIYCRPMRSGLRINKKDKKEQIINKMKKKIEDPDKYDAINLSKLNVKNGRGWVEFRIVGGKDYHKRFKEVERAILNFAEALEISINPSTKSHKITRRINAMRE